MGLANYPACKPLIYYGLGYNLKVEGSNPLLGTNPLIINNNFLRFFLKQ
jgi:hypothetical protein